MRLEGKNATQVKARILLGAANLVGSIDLPLGIRKAHRKRCGTLLIEPR